MSLARMIHIAGLTKGCSSSSLYFFSLGPLVTDDNHSVLVFCPEVNFFDSPITLLKKNILPNRLVALHIRTYF